MLTGRPLSGAYAVLTLVFAAVAWPLGAAAEDTDKGDGFDFFLSAGPHVIVQSTKANGTSSFGVSSDQENVATSMNFRLGGGLRGPTLPALPGRVRPVVWAAALLPLNESSAIGTRFEEQTVGGSERLEFSKYSIEYKTSVLAGVGLEFSVPVFDFEIGITPGVESLHLFGRYSGISTLEAQQGFDNVTLEVRGKQDFTQHFLGPALRLSTPNARLLGVSIDFWLDASLLFDVSGSRKEFVARSADGESAVYSFETGSSAFQVGSGIAIHWP